MLVKLQELTDKIDTSVHAEIIFKRPIPRSFGTVQFCEELFTEPSDCKLQEIKELSGGKMAQCSHVLLASICFLWVSEDKGCCLRFGQLFAKEAGLSSPNTSMAEIILMLKSIPDRG